MEEPLPSKLWQSPGAVQSSATDSAHQQIVNLPDKVSSLVMAANTVVIVIAVLFLGLFTLIIWQSYALDQNRYDWLQREVIDPLQRDENEHDKEIVELKQRMTLEERRK